MEPGQSGKKEITIILILLLLQSHSFICLMDSDSRHNFSEFAKPVSSKGLSMDEIHLSPDDMEMYIDLAPFLNPSPYVVPEDMSLTKVTFLCLSVLDYLVCVYSHFIR